MNGTSPAERPRAPRVRRVLNAVGLLGTLVLCVSWFLAFRPVTLGGPAGYVIVAGHSMEPTLRTGDLALTHRQSAYAVGDIVAFVAEEGVVIHRIVGGDAKRGYEVQGDNREQRDLWFPRPEHIVGKVWFYLPQVGTALALIRQPAYLGALAAAAAFFIAFTWGQPGRQPDKAPVRWPTLLRRGRLHQT